MVNLGKAIENDKKWNAEKRGPFMNVFINLTLTLPWICFIQKNDFKKDQILKKYKLEKWPIGYGTAKWLKNDQCWNFSLYDCLAVLFFCSNHTLLSMPMPLHDAAQSLKPQTEENLRKVSTKKDWNGKLKKIIACKQGWRVHFEWIWFAES